eukprot:CAMPEP_0198648140 /NCGR_PEP_ID=MMETSP1467-20131203/3262_1 /TAXON_ID=1462469 /ORGANISM="unid. sp., Strain CCMP2135" /LENGTH=84 /DNA_ID=CAMNT_0044383835 /DNA_START=1370 /DNA_END=1625 /DNA_ORIENTATION=+
MVWTEGRKIARWSKSQKPGLSSDCRLQLAGMKSESLVIADQQRRGEYVPELVHTARQATKAGGARSRLPNRKEGGAEGETGDWD